MTTELANCMPLPGQVLELHVFEIWVRTTGIRPIDEFVDYWFSPDERVIFSAMDHRHAYLGIVHEDGAFLARICSGTRGTELVARTRNTARQIYES
jgi:hypothetical protein